MGFPPPPYKSPLTTLRNTYHQTIDVLADMLEHPLINNDDWCVYVLQLMEKLENLVYAIKTAK